MSKPVAWMTDESRMRLANGGNCKGAVPVHGKPSSTATIPLYASPADTQGDAQDAARYRWLRDRTAAPSWYAKHVNDGTSTQAFDTALDAAMKEQPSDGAEVNRG